MNDSPRWHRFARFWRADIAADIDDEIGFHIETRVEELLALGASSDEAHATAARELGNMGQTKRLLRAMDGRHARASSRLALFDDLRQDVRIGARSLRKAPAFTIAAVLTLALGIGLNSAVYSIVDALLLRPLPGDHGSDLVVLGRTDDAMAQPHELSYPDFVDYRADTAIFRDLAAFATSTVTLAGGTGAKLMYVDQVTANYFSVLGIHPLLGRTFLRGEDDGELAHPVIVLTFKAWQARFGGNPGIVGDTVRLNNHIVTVIGITPPEFHGVRTVLDVDGFACLNQIWPGRTKELANRGDTFLNVFGRLRDGRSLTVASDAVRALALHLASEYPSTNKGVSTIVVPERRARPSIASAGTVPVIGAAFMTLVFLVLFIACANVASLHLARAAARQQERAIRAALGASRWRLARQVLVESLLLAMLGGAGALVFARAALVAVTSIQIASDIPFRWDVQIDGRVWLFTLAVVLFTALFAGLAPAVGAQRPDLQGALKSEARGTTPGGHQPLRSVLVGAQLAISVVVLACAGLFVRGARTASRVNLGFRTDHLAMMSATLDETAYDSVRGRQAYHEVARRVAALTGVRSAALAELTPFGFSHETSRVFPEGATVSVPDNGFTYFDNVVSPKFFTTLGIPLLRGRDFTDRDDNNAPAVAIVNDAFARASWPGEVPLGKRFRVGDRSGRAIEVIGVVGETQDRFIGETAMPYFFLPYTQSYRSDMTLFIHTSTDPLGAIPPARAVFAELDPRIPLFDVRTMETHLRSGQALLFVRLAAGFGLVFGALAVTLALVGVYGVISYSVAQRTREIGVRIALGARTADVVRLVAGHAALITAFGLAIGLLITLLTTRLLTSLLYGVAPDDPVVLGGVILTLAVVALMASAIPAMKAARIDPLKALRLN
ncbi:MAG TPA: ABC transporter permease [Gemmatimonadaceae bacterium]|nr:ABC transporter permease [Gemmatimonadaceae bacterium]